MRPDDIQIWMAVAALVVALSILRIGSIWLEKERYWRIVFWIIVIGGTIAAIWIKHPMPESLRPGDFAESFIAIAGWFLPP